MKVIAEKSVFVRANEMIDKCLEEGSKIFRVEMSKIEFERFYIVCVKSTGVIEDGVEHFEVRWEEPSRMVIQSGSYIVYKGVCFQYHEDYPDVKDTVEYI